MNDPIVDEVRRIRDAHAARFNYNLDAIYQAIKMREKQSGHRLVSSVAPLQAQSPEDQPAAETA